MYGHEKDFILSTRALLGLHRHSADCLVNLSPLACGAWIYLDFEEKSGIMGATMKRTVGWEGDRVVKLCIVKIQISITFQ